MLRILLAAAALAAVATLGPRPASAYGHAPWCAVMDIGWENVVSDCSYWSFKACVPLFSPGTAAFASRIRTFAAGRAAAPAHLPASLPALTGELPKGRPCGYRNGLAGRVSKFNRPAA